MGKVGGGRSHWALWSLDIQLPNPRDSPVLLHSCLGAFALASGTFFLLPLLGWMPIMVSATNPSPGRPPQPSTPTPLCNVSHGLTLQKALSKYLQMRWLQPPTPSRTRVQRGAPPGVPLVPQPLD